MTFALTVTLLGAPRLHSITLCLDLPVEHSLYTLVCNFWGTKLEASPYPRVMVFCDLVPSPSELTPKRFSRLSWLSFSSPGFSPGRRCWLSTGCTRLRVQTPHGSQVERAFRPRTPWTGFDSTKNFFVKSHPLWSPRPHLDLGCIFAAESKEVFLRRPTSATPPPMG